MMVTLPVYCCCCHPERLMGWIDVPESSAKEGARIQFGIVEPLDSTYTWWKARNHPESPSQVMEKTITLEVAMHHSPERGSILAVKSMDTPMETLRRIKYFVEAKSHAR